MRLADFILSNVEPILAEWEIFARSIGAGEHLDQLALRDHAGQILQATARDMKSPQTVAERAKKSKGLDHPQRKRRPRRRIRRARGRSPESRV